MNELEVSVIIVALNEEQSLPVLLGDLRRQGYNHARMEVLLVDSMSRDKTRDMMEGFALDHDFKRVVCLENPNRIQASGWNAALEEAGGDIIIRLDAHASVPADFVEKNVSCILEASRHSGAGRRPEMWIPLHLRPIGERYLKRQDALTKHFTGQRIMKCITGCGKTAFTFIMIPGLNPAGKQGPVS